jgi:hypothetical protein
MRYDLSARSHDAMEFLQAAMRNTRFLCGAIVVTAVVAILSDTISQRITLQLWDAADLLMVLFVAMYLRAAEHDEFRTVIKGMLFGVMMLLVLMYAVGR